MNDDLRSLQHALNDAAAEAERFLQQRARAGEQWAAKILRQRGLLSPTAALRCELKQETATSRRKEKCR